MTKAKQAIRILVADDHAIFRDGLRKLLEGADDVQIIGEASNGVECTKMLAKLKRRIFFCSIRAHAGEGWTRRTRRGEFRFASHSRDCADGGRKTIAMSVRAMYVWERAALSSSNRRAICFSRAFAKSPTVKYGSITA